MIAPCVLCAWSRPLPLLVDKVVVDALVWLANVTQCRIVITRQKFCVEAALAVCCAGVPDSVIDQ